MLYGDKNFEPNFALILVLGKLWLQFCTHTRTWKKQPIRKLYQINTFVLIGQFWSTSMDTILKSFMTESPSVWNALVTWQEVICIHCGNTSSHRSVNRFLFFNLLYQRHLSIYANKIKFGVHFVKAEGTGVKILAY